MVGARAAVLVRFGVVRRVMVRRAAGVRVDPRAGAHWRPARWRSPTASMHAAASRGEREEPKKDDRGEQFSVEAFVSHLSLISKYAPARSTIAPRPSSEGKCTAFSSSLSASSGFGTGGRVAVSAAC